MFWLPMTGLNDDPGAISEKVEVASPNRNRVFGAIIISGFLKFRTICEQRKMFEID